MVRWHICAADTNDRLWGLVTIYYSFCPLQECTTKELNGRCIVLCPCQNKCLLTGSKKFSSFEGPSSEAISLGVQDCCYELLRAHLAGELSDEETYLLLIQAINDKT